MSTLLTFLRYEMFFVLGAFALIVAYRLLTRRINTRGLLRDKVTGEFSPGRLQMLLVTGAIALYFLGEVLQTHEMPKLRQEFLLALAGSHGFYLAGKAYSVLVNKLAKITGRINQ